MAEEKKERKIVEVGDKKPAKKTETKTKAAAKPAAKTAPKAAPAKTAEPKERKVVEASEKKSPAEQAKAPKERATGKRVAAVILWLLGIACEVACILMLNGYLYLPNTTVCLIVGIVLDLIFVIIGSQLWKKANHIDPVSEKNKVKFFLWNQMGLIVAVIAFMPLIIFLLKDKELDKKTRKIVTAVACVALVIAGLTSVDWNPVSQEQKAAAEEAAAEETDGVVYWTTFGKRYHYDENCSSLKNSETLYKGTIAEAFEANRTTLCAFCEKAHQKQQEQDVARLNLYDPAA